MTENSEVSLMLTMACEHLALSEEATLVYSASRHESPAATQASLPERSPQGMRARCTP